MKRLFQHLEKPVDSKAKTHTALESPNVLKFAPVGAHIRRPTPPRKAPRHIAAAEPPMAPMAFEDDEALFEGHSFPAPQIGEPAPESVNLELLQILQSTLDARCDLEARLTEAQAQRDEALDLVRELRQELQAAREHLAQAEIREARTMNVAHQAMHIAQELAWNKPRRRRRRALAQRLEKLRG